MTGDHATFSVRNRDWYLVTPVWPRTICLQCLMFLVLPAHALVKASIVVGDDGTNDASVFDLSAIPTLRSEGVHAAGPTQDIRTKTALGSLG